MLVKVGASRRSEKQQDESNRECGEKNEAMARVRERHGAPFAESEDFVCRFLAFQHVLVIVGAKNCCASCLYHVYVRGEVYLAAGQGTQAAVEFQKIIDHSGIVWNCWTGALEMCIRDSLCLVGIYSADGAGREVYTASFEGCADDSRLHCFRRFRRVLSRFRLCLLYTSRCV